MNHNQRQQFQPKNDPNLAHQLAADLDLAHRLADAADAITQERFGAENLVIHTKPDRSNVTDADQAAETAILRILHMERPEDSVLGEETGQHEPGEHQPTHGGTGALDGSARTASTQQLSAPARRQWVIDPIDGTANYMRGVPGWATLISLEYDRTPVLGLVSSPATNTRWWAVRGGGAYKQCAGAQPTRLRVSGVATLADSWISTQSIMQWDEAGELDALIALSRACWRDRAFGDSLAYMLLAEGHIDIVSEHDVKPYDLSALVTIVEEAGGRFTNTNGQPGAWGGNSLATNGLLHDAALRILDAHRGSAPTDSTLQEGQNR